MKRLNEMDEKELYYYLKRNLSEELFEEIYGDWKPEEIEQLKLFEGSDEKQGF